MKYKDFETLKSNEDFKRVYTKRKSYANRELIMYIAKNGTDTKRLGVSVSKKVGNSIVRHRLARPVSYTHLDNFENADNFVSAPSSSLILDFI